MMFRSNEEKLQLTQVQSQLKIYDIPTFQALASSVQHISVPTRIMFVATQVMGSILNSHGVLSTYEDVFCMIVAFWFVAPDSV